MSPLTSTLQAAVDICSIIDTAARDRAVIVGSPPPLGRDLDLLIRATDRVAIQHALRSHGYRPAGRAWVRLNGGIPEVVELVTPAEWALPDRAVEDLFDHAVPVRGRSQLCLASPAHQLLILARKLPRASGRLSQKHYDRIAETLRLQPTAFDDARARAGDWRVKSRIRRLQRRYERPSRGGRLLRHVHRPRRGAVIALSGLDGAGKSTQAEALRTALAKLGYNPVIVWTPLGSNVRLRSLAEATKHILARFPIGPYAHGVRDPGERLLSLSAPDAPPPSLGRRSAVAAWSTVGAAVTAASLRRSARGTRFRGRIVIYDRYVLDTIVDLRFSYAREMSLRFQEMLVRLFAPSPRCAFLLDLPAEVAHARKPDWSLDQTRLRAKLYRREQGRLGLSCLDAQRPRDQLTAEITLTVLDAIAS
jgi:thymidylate kinase